MSLACRLAAAFALVSLSACTSAEPVEPSGKAVFSSFVYAGEEADPDRPRDFLKDWEDRLSFERRYGAGNSGEVRRTEKVLAVLHRFDRPLFLTT